MKTRDLLMCGVGVVAGLAAVARPAMAADADAAKPAAAPATAQLEELIVTAQRREESSQRVPIAMTVLSGEQVAEHFRTSNEIAKMVPNVQLDTVDGFGTPRTSIRGIAQSDFNPNATTSNMIYIDDVPLDLPMAQGVPVWDLGRVEVLRGPQGTLFGRNATGGAIRFIAAMPTDRTEGYADLTYGVHDQREVHAAFSTPITDTLRARISYVSMDFGGDVENLTLHEKENKQRYYGVRGILQWTPTDQLSAVLRAQHFVGDTQVLTWKTTPGLTNNPGAGNFCGPVSPIQPACNHGYTGVAQIQQAFGFTNPGPGSNYYVTQQDSRPNEHIEHTPVSLNIDYKLGFATLTSVTGFLQAYQGFIEDLDSQPIPFLTNYVRTFDRQWTQELRLTSTGEGKFKWIVGAFYMNEFVKGDNDYFATEYIRDYPFFFAPNTPEGMYSRGVRNRLETYAGFLHTSYQITPKLTATAAVRYTKEDKSTDYRFRTIWNFPSSAPNSPIQSFVDFVKAVDSGDRGSRIAAANPLTASISRGFSATTWHFGLDYQLDDHTLIYGLVSRGFKGGAFPPTANSLASIKGLDGNIIVVRPETVTDYEAGVKSDLLPGRLRVNGSVFYYDYQDYQTNQFIAGLQILSNLPKAELYGAELEVTAIPVENLTINVGLGALHTKITKADDPTLVGHKLPNAQDFNWNALVKYDIHTSLGTFTPEVSAKHTGSYYGTKENVPAGKMGNFTTYDARIGFESNNQKYYASIWGTNLGDTERPIFISDTAEFWGSNIAYVNQHRRYGVTLGARF